MVSYLMILWIFHAIATMQQRDTGSVFTMAMHCRKMCVIYKVTCRKCKNFYIGDMQQRMTNHQGQHLDDIKKLQKVFIQILLQGILLVIVRKESNRQIRISGR